MLCIINPIFSMFLSCIAGDENNELEKNNNFQDITVPTDDTESEGTENEETENEDTENENTENETEFSQIYYIHCRTEPGGV